MNKSSVPTGLQQKHIQHFQLAQSVIDGLVHTKNNVRNELFSEYPKGSVYDLDLDTTEKFVLGDDLHEARIFPHIQRKKVKEALDTSKLNEQFELFVDRVFEMVKVTLKFLYTVLVRMDAACEKIVLKINELGAAGVHTDTQKVDVITQKMELSAKKIEMQEKHVTVASTTLDIYNDGACMYDSAQAVYSTVKNNVENENFKTQNTLIQVVKILYTQLRYGLTKDIDSV